MAGVKKATLSKTTSIESKSGVKRVKNTYNISKLKKMGLQLTSSQIRFLSAEGWDRADIAELLGIRYQHVRNVLITPVTQPLEKVSEA